MINKKSKNYKNSNVRSIYKLITPLYMSLASSTIFKDLKITFNLKIFFTITSLIITTTIFQVIKINLSTNTIYSINAFVKRLSRYRSEYRLSKLLK